MLILCSQEVLDIGLVPFVINVIDKGDFRSQREAVWVMNNLASGGLAQQVLSTVEMGSIQVLSNLINCKDVKVISIIIETLTNIFNVSIGPILIMFVA